MEELAGKLAKVKLTAPPTARQAAARPTRPPTLSPSTSNLKTSRPTQGHPNPLARDGSSSKTESSSSKKTLPKNPKNSPTISATKSETSSTIWPSTSKPAATRPPQTRSSVKQHHKRSELSICVSFSRSYSPVFVCRRERAEDALTLLELGPKEMLIKQPVPFDHYIALANEPLQLRDITRGPQALLIVLDINGTLLSKNPNNRKSLKLRPNVDKFLTYLFSNHKVAFVRVDLARAQQSEMLKSSQWSSSTPDTVACMLNELLDDRRVPDLPHNPYRGSEWREQIVTAWTRRELNLGEYYWQNPQVYKQLWQMWSNAQVQASAEIDGRWDQTNTVLVDDTTEKASSEPFNLVQVKEMIWGEEDDAQGDVLAQVALYISNLTDYTNASAYMRQHPFVYKPEGGENLTWEYGITNLLDFDCLRVN